MTVLDLVVTVNKLVVTVPDSVMKLVVVDTAFYATADAYEEDVSE
jgi:hypothetical protein